MRPPAHGLYSPPGPSPAVAIRARAAPPRPPTRFIQPAHPPLSPLGLLEAFCTRFEINLEAELEHRGGGDEGDREAERRVNEDLGDELPAQGVDAGQPRVLREPGMFLPAKDQAR